MVAFAISSGAMQLRGSNVTAATMPKTVQPCAPKQLRVIPGPSLAPMGTKAYLFILENVSKDICTLEGYPTLRMLDAGGNIIAARVTHISASNTVNAATGVTLVTVKPGWSAFFDVRYPNWLDYPPATCPISDHVTIHIPDMKKSIIFKWRIQPFGHESAGTPHCGEIGVSFVFGPYRMTKSQLNQIASER
jgi:hypothetical protein